MPPDDRQLAAEVNRQAVDAVDSVSGREREL